MATRWWFTEYATPRPPRWGWRTLAVDGSIERQSGEFENYGAAVHDAIVHGFRPDEDHWAIESTHLITHFLHGQKTVDITTNDKATLFQPRRRASFARPAARRRSEREIK